MTDTLADLPALSRDAEVALNERDFRRVHELCLRMLSVDPAHADALFLLAMIAAEHGNFPKALEVIDRALAIAKAEPDYYAQRGRCLIALGRLREGFEAAVRALDLRPRSALAFDTIGVVMTRAGAQAEAVAPFRRAVELDPDRAAYRYNLGAALQFVGDFAAAAAEFRAALAIDPSHFRSWSSLAQVGRSALTPSEVAEIERQLEAGELAEDRELHLRHALAKQLEDERRYSEAFRHLARGKARKRASRALSFDDHRQLFEAAARTLDFPAGESGATSAEPIFIVGMPRTGTTLVERILSNHPAVFAAGELENFGVELKRATAARSGPVLDAQTLAAAASIDWRSLGEAYIASTRPRTGRTARFIDKLPLNFFYAALIQRALPNAKIICLRRHPLDSCLSNYRQLFATTFSYYDYSYDLLDTGRYYLEFDALMRRWREALPDNFTEVRYEDVVDSTEREARRLVEFCGLDWDARCLEFERNAAPVATPSALQVRQPIYRTAVERWKNYETEIEPLRQLLAAGGVL